MTHYMNLNPKPYELILKGIKTIELRLLDEKRKQIKIGDTLIFKNADNYSEQLTCIVKELHVFDSFDELYKLLPLEKCGYLPTELENASPRDMEIYYPQEKQRLYGVVGIELELV